MSHNDNARGAFERARARWHFGMAYVCRGMGRGAAGALQAAVLLIEHTNRAIFHRDGALVAFPALDLLALLAGVNEKTIRRSINKLEGAGLVRIQHRRNDSNLYYLTIPPEAETHLFECDAAIIKRRKTRRSGAPKCPPDRTDGKGADTKCPTTSDYTSDLHSIPKGHPSDAEEKRLGEKERGVKPLRLGQQPKLQRSTPMVQEVAGSAEANPATIDYAAALGSFRPVVSRFDRGR